VDDPWWIASLDREILGGQGPDTRLQAAEAMDAVVAQAIGEGQPGHRVTRHLMHLFAGIPGARAWRRTLSERRDDPDGGLAAALQVIRSRMEAA